MLLQNVGWLSKNYMVLYPRWQNSSLKQLCVQVNQHSVMHSTSIIRVLMIVIYCHFVVSIVLKLHCVKSTANVNIKNTNWRWQSS
jgi:hypothetical protein